MAGRDQRPEFRDDIGIFYATDDEEEVIWFREFLTELLCREPFRIQNPSFCMRGRTNDRPEIGTITDMIGHIARDCVFTILYLSENFYREPQPLVEAGQTFVDRLIWGDQLSDRNGIILLSNINDTARSTSLLHEKMPYFKNQRVMDVSKLMGRFYQKGRNYTDEETERQVRSISWDEIRAADRSFRRYIGMLADRLRNVPSRQENGLQPEVTEQLRAPDMAESLARSPEPPRTRASQTCRSPPPIQEAASSAAHYRASPNPSDHTYTRCTTACFQGNAAEAGQHAVGVGPRELRDQARDVFYGDVCVDGEGSLSLPTLINHRSGMSSRTYPKERYEQDHTRTEEGSEDSKSEDDSGDPSANSIETPIQTQQGDPSTVLLIQSDADEHLARGADSLRIRDETPPEFP